MGWREVLNDVLSEQPLDSKEVIPSLMQMPAPDRIALARELLAGTPWADALDDAMQWCVDTRDAMLADDAGDV